MALPKILDRFVLSWKAYCESQSKAERNALTLRNFPHSRPEIEFSPAEGEVRGPILKSKNKTRESTAWKSAENRQKAARKAAKELLSKDLLPSGKELSSQLVKQKPKEDPRLLLRFLLLLEGDDDDRETAVKLWPDLLVELKACELRATKGNAVKRKPRRATTIKRDLQWLKEYRQDFEGREGGGVTAFAQHLSSKSGLQRGYNRATVSKALTRARAEEQRRAQTKTRQRESLRQA